MKESKTIKALSSVLLIILISILIISIFMLSIKESEYYNEERYFNSDVFVDSYMRKLNANIYELIHDNNDYQSIQDEKIKICYNYAPVSIHDYPDATDMYFLIIYKNKALTNVELTNTTNTIESIKSYIKSNENAKNVDIIYGDIQSESDIIQKIGLQYLDCLTEIYYTRTDEGLEYIMKNMHIL